MEHKVVWVVGHKFEGEENPDIWELIGIFDKESDAIIACKNANYFVGPIQMNFAYPENVEWEEGYFPIPEEDDYDEGYLYEE